MFIEFETGSGRTLLNVRHIVQVKRFQDLSDAITGEKVSNFPVCRKAKSSPRLRLLDGLSAAGILKFGGRPVWRLPFDAVERETLFKLKLEALRPPRQMPKKSQSPSFHVVDG